MDTQASAKSKIRGHHADSTPVESVHGLEDLPGIRAVFICRSSGVDVSGEREDVLKRLADRHRRAADASGFAGIPFVGAQQVHGADVACVREVFREPVPGVDGLITNHPGLALAIYVADCAAVFLAEKHGKAIGLLHSGRKGTELGIATAAVKQMGEIFDVAPGNLIASISPCIRPPHYEVDFAAEIRRQLAQAGVGEIHDTEICTASDPARYYSYRREMGHTGRMLALICLTGYGQDQAPGSRE